MIYCGLNDQHFTPGRFFLCLSLWRSLLTNCNQNTRSRKECIDFLAPPGVFLVPPCKLVDITRRGELSNVDTWGGHCLTSKCFLMVSVKADRAMYKHISMGSYVYLEPLKSRVHICRDQWDRRSRKIFVDCVNFSVNNTNCEQNLPKPTHIAYILLSLFSKFLRKMSNEWSNFFIFRKSLCSFYAKRVSIG